MSRILKFVAAVVVTALASVGVLSGVAAAQYEPPVPTVEPGVDPGVSAEELLAVINSNAAASDAAAAAAAGDVAGAEAAVATIEGLLADFPDNPAIKAALASAKASADAAAAAAAPASVPAAAAAPANLAFTGNEVSLPVTAGAILIGSGGLLLLAANKRSSKD